jgi:hypothetical protein
MPSVIEEFDFIRRAQAHIRSQKIGGYCQQRDKNTTEGCWCIGAGMNGMSNAPCPPRDQPTQEAASVPDRERALSTITPVPWHRGQR